MDTLTLARDFASLLLDTAAKGTALLLLAVLAAWLCRRSSAALRHSIWCMTMGGLLVLPVASWALPAWQLPILPPEPVAAPAPVAEVVRLSPPSPAQGATGEGLDSPVLRRSTAGATVLGQDTFKDTGGPERPPVAPSAPPVVEPVRATAPASVEAPAPPLTAIEWTALLVSTLWSLGVSLFGVLLLVGLWRTVQLRRASLIVHEGEWPVMLVELRQRLGLARSVELREHAQSVVPLTWGIWRPVVLLPKLARAWDEPMRRAVLLHELAHVQRGDVACQVLGRLTCVLYWFHPLAWFALRQLRQEREQACDDAVVQSGERASDYAEQLLQVARLCCAPRGLSLGVAMAEGSSIERRILSLFDSARGHGPLSRRVAIVSVLVGIAILCGLAPIQPTASEAKPVLNQPDTDEGVVLEPTPAVEAPSVLEKEPAPMRHTEDAPIDSADIPLDKVIWWGEPVDGLEPGLWLTKTEDPRNLRIPMDSLVSYRVVVRNTTDKEIEFLVRLLPFDGMDVPYLIPSSQLDAKGRIVAPQPAKEYQAQGAANVLDGVNAARIITLAAGESVLFPGEEKLYVGKTDDIYIPRISDFVPGTHWIVQPLMVHPLSDKERAELDRQLSEVKVTKIDRSGKTRQEPVVLVEAPDNSKGKFAYAKYHLEVGTLDASAHRNAKTAIWGEVEQGMQCGIRILNPQPSYQTGDTLEAELLWRNTSEAVISTTRPRLLDFYSMIDDADGKHMEIDFGARYDLLPGGHDFQPGEVRSLGVTKVTLVAQGTPGPKDNKEPGHITLEPGKYKLSASGGVGNISPRSGKYEFTVVDDETVTTKSKAAEPLTVDAKPAFTEFVVNIQPFEAPRNGYIEQLKFLADGKCWYKVEGREAAPNLPARTGAVFDHMLSPERVQKLNQLLGETKWLTEAAVAKGQAPPLHATAYHLTLKRDGQEKTIACTERGAELYKPLLHFLDGIAVQERVVYLHDYLSGQEGTEAWLEVGRELKALRGEPYGKSPYDIDYARYLPIAVRIVRDHHGKPDEELVPAIRLIGHLKAQAELEFIHRMAQDRSSYVRQEVAWTLGQIHDPKSLPVLLAMMSAAGTRWEVGFELIQWGDDAVPGIVKLIELSTKDGSDERERVTGEDMIRAYLQHWDKIPQPIHEDVITAVKQALEAADPMKSIRTSYHKEFLQKVAETPAPKIPQFRPNGPVAPKPGTPPAVDMKRELLQRLVRGGKISSDSLNAMITLVSSEGAYDSEFISVILAEFDKSCGPDSSWSKRNLLAVLTSILEIHGSTRWQDPESGPDALRQAVIPDPKVLSQLSSEILNHLITQGRKADRSDIDAFVMALRQAHHADGIAFLRDVLRNPEVNALETPPAQTPPAVQTGKWADNLGGTWREAKFHAAIGLAELGESEGVEWLIEHARPNDFGLGASLFQLQHSRDPKGFMQISCRHSMIDLFGLKPTAEFAQLEVWWKANQGQFHPRRVALGRALQPPSAELPQSEQKPAPPGPLPPQPVGQALPELPDVSWQGDEVTPEQIAKLAGKKWGTVTLTKDKYNGAIIEGLRHTTSIRTLRLYGNDLAGQTSRLHHIAGLTELEIGTPLNALDMDAIGRLTDLTSLSLPQELTVNVLGAREIARLVNLRSLKLYLVNIDDTAFAELRTLTKLEELDLTHTRITDAGLSVLANMPQLRTLELDRFSFATPQLTDACLPVVCQLQKLERLSLSGEISDEGLKLVARLPNLKSLWLLNANKITGEGLAALEHSTVESLLLSPEHVGEAGLAHLKKCKALKHIQVNGQFNGLGEFEQWQQALPDVDWSFTDP